MERERERESDDYMPRSQERIGLYKSLGFAFGVYRGLHSDLLQLQGRQPETFSSESL